VFSAERGSAWTLAYPHYSVVVPQPDLVRVPVASPLQSTDTNLMRGSAFDDLWSRRTSVDIGAAEVFIPSIDDLILTKRIAARPKDAEDIRLLERLKEVRDE
jgi:hypothetical protein